MAATPDLFNGESVDTIAQIRPLEPLYSMLIEMPAVSLKYTLASMQQFSDESELDTRLDNIGLTKREYIQQIHMAMDARGIRH